MKSKKRERERGRERTVIAEVGESAGSSTTKIIGFLAGEFFDESVQSIETLDHTLSHLF
jgi:hypothetical protein